MKFRKKPVEVEVWHFTKDNLKKDDSWVRDRKNGITLFSQFAGSKIWLEIKTLEGTMVANEGDYIIKGVQGELYLCKPDIFGQTYERVD